MKCGGEEKRVVDVQGGACRAGEFDSERFGCGCHVRTRLPSIGCTVVTTDGNQQEKFQDRVGKYEIPRFEPKTNAPDGSMPQKVILSSVLVVSGGRRISRLSRTRFSYPPVPQPEG